MTGGLPLALRAIVAACACVVAAQVSVADASAAQCIKPSKLGVVFVVDDSGSMSTSDSAYLRADAVRIALDQLPDGSVASAGSFDTNSRTFFDPVEIGPGNRTALADDVSSSLYPTGLTDYGMAFGLANELLAKTANVQRRAVVFLSDGEPTDNAFANETLPADVPVFTVGFGSITNDTLDRIAARNGGQAFHADRVSDIQNAFAQIVAALNCDIPNVATQFDLAPGETKAIDFGVEYADEFRAVASWDVGDLSVVLRRPDGSIMQPGATLPQETFFADTNSAVAASSEPAPGTWQLQLTAAAGNGVPATVSINVFNRPKPKNLPVVLLSGKGSSASQIVPGADGRANCGGAEKLTFLCEQLTAKGYPVWVVGASPDGGSATLDTSEGLDLNAFRLRSYLATNPAGIKGRLRPVFVGHSFGGLVARRAISALGVKASALFTIGTPHGGSYWADALEETVGGCRGFGRVLGGVVGAPVGPIGALVGGAASWKGCDTAENEWYGNPINQDLTYYSRRADWMEQPRVPVWVYAGTPGSIWKVSNKYFSPNDFWVGEGSAHGDNANLGAGRTKLKGGDWHDGQLGSQDVAGKVKTALGELLAGGKGQLRTSSVAVAAAKRGKAERRGGKQGGGKPGAGKPRGGKRGTGKRGGKRGAGKRRGAQPRARTTRLGLRFSESAERLRRRATRVGSGLLVTRAPFSVACGGGTVQSFEIGGGLHGAYTRGRCGLVGVDPRDAIFMAARRPHGLRGVAVYRRGRKPTVTVTVRGADEVKVQIGRRRAVRAKKARTKDVRKARRAAKTIVLPARRLRGQSAFVRARIGKRSFSARLPSGG